MGITKVGLSEMANLGIDDDSPEYWAFIAIGTGTTEFINTQTALVSQSGSRASATVTRETTTHSNDTMRFTADIAITSTVTITEIAIFNASTGGEMLARTVIGTPKSMVNGQTYSVTYDVPISEV